MTVFDLSGHLWQLDQSHRRLGRFLVNMLVNPVKSKYFDNYVPQIGEVITGVGRATAEDIDVVLDVADKWGGISFDRVLRPFCLKTVGQMEQKLQDLAVIELWGNGKAIFDTISRPVARGRSLPLLSRRFARSKENEFQDRR